MDEQVIETTDTPVPDVTYANNSSAMSPKAMRQLRLVQMTSKFASTMALRPISAHLDTQWTSEAPAWSDSDNIWFNPHKLGDLTDPKRMTAAKGLTIHEISHILLTPRNTANIVKWVRTNKLWQSFNALEDQRIETLMTARYPAIKQWLVGTIANFLLDNKAYYNAQFPILWGRKYLPLEVRNASAQAFKDPINVASISAVIDEYVTLNLADNKVIARAQELIEAYDRLVNESFNRDGSYNSKDTVYKKMGDPNGHAERKNGQWKPGTSKPLDKATQEAMAKRAEQAMAGDGEPSAGVGNGIDLTEEILTRRQYDDVLDEMVFDNRKRLEPELTNMAKQLSGDAGLKSSNVKTPVRVEGWARGVAVETAMVVKSFTRELMAIKAEHDPGWDKHMSSGKLNVQRYSQGCEVDEAFDQWNMGREDAVDIECVILLDTSPSMSWCINEAYQSMWVVKRSMDKIGASTTVLTYDDKAGILYSANERATTQVRSGNMGNGTEPLAALQYARNIIADSRRAIKIVISITDGMWAASEECDNILRNLRNNGVITGLAYVDDSDWWAKRYAGTVYENRSSGPKKVDTHGCEVATLVNTPQELAQFARKLVKASITRNLERV